MKYVIGIDLGTSAVKILLLNQDGNIVHEVSKAYSLIHEKAGYSEQNPQDWVDQTVSGLSELLQTFEGNPSDIEGISFSGQMHGLVLLDENNKVLRNAILWNDVRTTNQCQQIYDVIGENRLLEITKNPALEGFTLPKLLWVKEHEPHLYEKLNKFVLPKDYLRYRLTEKLHTEYSDAAGTLLLNVSKKAWSKEICDALDINIDICPPLVEPHAEVGFISSKFAKVTGLDSKTRVFAGGADNACGAIGSGILEDGKTLCSIGTSGVVLSHETNNDKEFDGKVHYFNHGLADAYYTMGVTLSAGHSLSWFKEVFAPEESFEEILTGVENVPIGSNGLLFTPYLVGERTPHADALIRASFIGMDSSHVRSDFVRAVLEGITFSLNESLEIFRQEGKKIDTIVSTGGGTKNEHWLQMQADIFNAKIIKLSSEQGPGLGAAMIAAYGCGWFPSLQDCAKKFLTIEREYEPIVKHVQKYMKLFEVYKEVYLKTKSVNEKLMEYRQ
ncbi:xylulokinase [Sporosarcina ureilytica]|uniref:Xylulose kinase n=1 Tax=Sporosarcina ureilytica TaxID=298596 RepID=A0A1D8JJ22_9BACL|nr:xylulokinase [Sporosarcina ureilytica]AOV08711.1 xylulokinase [Sporosarcina ureilytica]